MRITSNTHGYKVPQTFSFKAQNLSIYMELKYNNNSQNPIPDTFEEKTGNRI